MSRRATPQNAAMYLDELEREGYIGGYEQIDRQGAVAWKVQVPGTRRQRHYGVMWDDIVLSTREVYAFVEGAWAGRRAVRNTRVGAEP